MLGVGGYAVAWQDLGDPKTVHGEWQTNKETPERKGGIERGEGQKIGKHIHAGENRPGHGGLGNRQEKQYDPMKLSQLSKYGHGDGNRPRYV
eukprot:1142998-Pelagomonas_calceolata.AAC.3